MDLDRVKRIWYLSPMRAAKVQASLRIRAVSPEPPLLAPTIIESRGTFRQKARSLAPLNDWACAVKNCHDGMLEDTNSLDAAHLMLYIVVREIILQQFDEFKTEICGSTTKHSAFEGSRGPHSFNISRHHISSYSIIHFLIGKTEQQVAYQY